MKKLRYIILLIFLVLILGAGILCFHFNYELNKKNTSLAENILVEIKEGQSSAQIADYLLKEKVIENRKIFLAGLKILQKDLNPGFYEMTPGMTTKEVILKIDKKETKILKVTFPEGWRMEQMAQRLAANNVVSFEEFIMAAKGYEGKLFPDTYFFDPRMTGGEVVQKMAQNYSDRINTISSEKVTENDLILASIVEREAANDDERAIIAGIYKNRLERGMKLDADPTVQYGKDNNVVANLSSDEQKEFKFWQKITVSDYYNVKSSYNTYLNKGLPPTPICNPGLKSIEAVLSPEKSNYLYFFHRDGTIYPSESLEKHNQTRSVL